MNLLLLHRDQLDADGTTARTSERQARHMGSVLGAVVGDTLRAGVLGGRRGLATVLEIGADGARVALDLSEPPSPQPPVDLVLAVPRPKVGRRVLQHAATFGVGRIDLVNAWRVDKSYLDSPVYDAHDMRSQLALGCEQGQTTWLPTVALHRRLMAFFEHDEARPPVRRLIAHPGSARDVAELPTDPAERTVVAIGPEGGWIQRELDTFAARGYTPIWLSDRTLRVESAIAAALSQLELARRTRPVGRPPEAQ